MRWVRERGASAHPSPALPHGQERVSQRPGGLLRAVPSSRASGLDLATALRAQDCLAKTDIVDGQILTNPAPAVAERAQRGVAAAARAFAAGVAELLPLREDRLADDAGVFDLVLGLVPCEPVVQFL